MTMDSTDHKEAIRLAKHLMRLPVSTALMGFVFLSGVASAAFTVFAIAR